MELSIYIYFLLVIVCLLIGFFGGLLGIALGAVRLPVMIFLGVEPIIAASTNLLAVIFGSFAGLVPAIRQKRVPIKSSLNIAFPSMIAAFLGGYYAVKIPEIFLIIIISFCLIISGLVMVFYKFQIKEVADANKSRIKEFFVSIIISYFGGIVGLALGVLRVPAFVYFLKMNIKTAGGINLFLSVLVGISAYLGHSFSGKFDYMLVSCVVIPTIIGMYFGSKFVRIANQDQLRRLLGIILLILSIVILLRFL
jgi:hypothetical protein